MRDFTRTVESGYWAAAVIAGAVWVALSPFIGSRWIRTDGLSSSQASAAILMMGVAAALQFPFSMYGGGLQGLQRQVTYNAILIGGAVLRSLGAVLALQFFGPTVGVFFAWQILVSATQTLVSALLLWSSLPKGPPPRFDGEQLREVWRFAAAAGGTAALGVARSQLDKVVLTRLLTLAQFGAYALAGVLSSAVYFLGTPFFIAFFPRFSEMHAEGDERRLARAYHDGCQMLSVVLLPATAVASIFSYDVLWAWTMNAAAAAGAARPAALLIVAACFAALSGLPYTLQLACGWSRLALDVSALALVLSAPILAAAAYWYGAVGTAAALVAVNAVYTVGLVELMHRRILPGENRQWYLVDVALPLAASLIVAAFGRLAMPDSLSRAWLIGYIAGTSVLTMGAAILVTPTTRRLLVTAARTGRYTL